MHGQENTQPACRVVRTLSSVCRLVVARMLICSRNMNDLAPGCRRLRRSWDSSSQPTPSYPQQSLDVIAALVQRYAAAPALLGFGLLNEPTVRADPPA